MAQQWRDPAKRGGELNPRVFHIPSESKIFGNYYDEVQDSLKAMAGMDELLPGSYVYTD